VFTRSIHRRDALKLLGASTALAGLTGPAAANAGHFEGADQSDVRGEPVLLTAARLFDGQRMQADIAVRVADGTIAAIGPADSIQTDGACRIDLGDGTILPGFIDLHVHIGAQNIPFDRVLT